MLLTSHQTAKTPILIWQAHCVHRGGYEIEFPPEDETHWQKIYGPAFIYLNEGGEYERLWDDAQVQAATMKNKWPFEWMEHTLFPRERGRVTGQLYFDDGTPAVDAWVVLAPEGEHWSEENKGYHFWSRTDAAGRFSVDNVRPGRYALFALGADQFFEYSQDGVAVSAGGETGLEGLLWQRVVRGRRIWQIGTADRST